MSRRDCHITQPAMQTCIAIAWLFLLSGCASFHRDWRAADCLDCQAQSLEGRWEGTWCSHVTGHHGTLRAIITRQEDGCYYAQFRAKYAGIIRFKFDVPVTVTESTGTFHFDGQADLGWPKACVLNYSGSGTACELEAGYCTTDDHGAFELRRVGDSD